MREDPQCIKCGADISMEHGGIGCSCGSWYCCDTSCINKRFLKLDIGQSQKIKSCPECICEYCGNDCGWTCEKAVVLMNREEGYEIGVAESKDIAEQLTEVKKIIQNWHDDEHADGRDVLNELTKVLNILHKKKTENVFDH